MKWRLKSCPRCSGDLYIQTGDKGSDIVCLQCGAVFDPESLSAVSTTANSREYSSAVTTGKG